MNYELKKHPSAASLAICAVAVRWLPLHCEIAKRFFGNRAQKIAVLQIIYYLCIGEGFAPSPLRHADRPGMGIMLGARHIWQKRKALSFRRKSPIFNILQRISRHALALLYPFAAQSTSQIYRSAWGELFILQKGVWRCLVEDKPRFPYAFLCLLARVAFSLRVSSKI